MTEISHFVCVGKSKEIQSVYRNNGHMLVCDDPVHLKDMTDDTLVVVLRTSDGPNPLYQCFEAKGLYEWLARNRRNPLTRQEVTMKDFRKIEMLVMPKRCRSIARKTAPVPSRSRSPRSPRPRRSSPRRSEGQSFQGTRMARKTGTPINDR